MAEDGLFTKDITRRFATSLLGWEVKEGDRVVLLATTEAIDGADRLHDLPAGHDVAVEEIGWGGYEAGITMTVTAEVDVEGTATTVRKTFKEKRDAWRDLIGPATTATRVFYIGATARGESLDWFVEASTPQAAVDLWKTEETVCSLTGDGGTEYQVFELPRPAGKTRIIPWHAPKTGARCVLSGHA